MLEKKKKETGVKAKKWIGLKRRLDHPILRYKAKTLS